MHFKFASGAKIPLTRENLGILLKSTELKAFAGLCFLAFNLLNPYQSHREMEPWQSAVVITIMEAIVFLLYFLGLRIALLTPITTLPSWTILLPIAGITSYVGDWMAWRFGGSRLEVMDVWFLWLFHFVVFLLLELLFSLVFLPLLGVTPEQEQPDSTGPEADAAAAPKAGPPAEEARAAPPAPEMRGQIPDPAPPVNLPQLYVSGSGIDKKDIQAITAHDHYVSISLTSGPDIFVRSRISDLLGQMPHSLGYSIHRSHWVAWTGISAVIRENKRLFVVLNSGDRLPVSRGKQPDFIERCCLRDIAVTTAPTGAK